jgi:nucleotide-binding universal stress UspA family protein
VISFRRIVVALDYSANSDHALETAIDLARRFGAELHLAHAFEIPVPIVTPYEVAIPENYIEPVRQEARRRLEKARDEVAGQGIAVKAHLTESPAASGIVRVAEEVGADLIVMGTRGNTGLKHLLLGSVAERTLRTAPCSVLTVKEREAGGGKR